MNSQRLAIEGRRVAERQRDAAWAAYRVQRSVDNGAALVGADHLVTLWRLRQIDYFLNDLQIAVHRSDDGWRSRLPSELMTHAALNSTEDVRLIRAYCHEMEDAASARMSLMLDRWPTHYVQRFGPDA